MKSAIEDNKKETRAKKQYSDDKMTNLTEEFKTILAEITDHINSLKLSANQKYYPKPPNNTTVVPYKRRDAPLEVGQSTKTGGMWTLKHEIISPGFYEILINTELKVYTAMDLKNFYNHFNICINAVTRIQ